MGFDQSQSFDAFDFDEVDPSAPGSRGGGDFLPGGGYCLLITEANPRGEYGKAEIGCEVIAAKDESLIGRGHREFLQWPSPTHKDGGRTAAHIMLAWPYAAHTSSEEKVRAQQQLPKDDPQRAFENAVPPWLEAMVGCKVLAYVKCETYDSKNTGEKKESSKIEGRVWALDNPKGKGIPGWVGPGNQPPPPPTGSPVPSGPAPADPFGGLV
jgi:hypothetical protein